jgi:hypothetical protein
MKRDSALPPWERELRLERAYAGSDAGGVKIWVVIYEVLRLNWKVLAF